MPQTEEAISHARAAGVPIVVALNKIDLPGCDPQRAVRELANNELLPTEWGGDTEVIKTSATTGEGVDELLSVIDELAGPILAAAPVDRRRRRARYLIARAAADLVADRIKTGGDLIDQLADAVLNGQSTPTIAAKAILESKE